MAFKFQVFGKIARPVATVFNAVTDPAELSSYFTTGGASAPLREGTTVYWDFADFPGKFPVNVTRVVPNERIELSWESGERGYDTQVVMTFEAIDAGDAARVEAACFTQDDGCEDRWIVEFFRWRGGIYRTCYDRRSTVTATERVEGHDRATFDHYHPADPGHYVI